jgi:hypothetical protein
MPVTRHAVSGRLVDRATTRRIVVTRHHHEHDDHAGASAMPLPRLDGNDNADYHGPDSMIRRTVI